MLPIIALAFLLYSIPAHALDLPAPDSAPYIKERVHLLELALAEQGLSDYKSVLHDARLLIYPTYQPETKEECRGWKGHIKNCLFADGSIVSGLASLKEHQAVLDFAKDTCGVPPEIIVAIRREETNFGKMEELHMALSAYYRNLTTRNISSWQLKWTMMNFIATVKLCKETSTGDCFSIMSSYKGAIGPNQILPANLATDGLSYFEDGIPDPRRIEDAYLTTCMFLKRVGWHKNPVRAIACYLGCTKKYLTEVRRSPYSYVGAVLLYAAGMKKLLAGEELVLASLIKDLRKLVRVQNASLTPKNKPHRRPRRKARAVFLSPITLSYIPNSHELGI